MFLVLVNSLGACGGRTFASTKLLNDMKNILKFAVVIIASFFAPHSNLNAQQNALKVTPFQPLRGKFTAQYERAFDKNNSFVLEYQRWNEKKSSSDGAFILGIGVSSHENVHVTGQRFQGLLRHYPAGAMNGLFFEGGGFFGKHDIVIAKENSTLNMFELFIGDPFDYYESSSSVKKYEDVKVVGLKGGIGWQKSRGPFTLECSGGLNYTAANSQNIAPTIGMKPLAPYGRLALGVRF
jgi:hypothetical protein